MSVALPSFNVLSLCAGGGGLDLGVKLAVPHARTVCYVEIEAYACEVLASRMASGEMDEAPIWSDLRSFDGVQWRGVVDCVIGGYPCQPFSIAGKQRGADDPRHLWPTIAELIESMQGDDPELGPSVLFFENVSNHLRLGAREVVGRLHEMGYRTAIGLFTAEEVGATHKRERLFVMAHASGARRWQNAGSPFGDEAAHGCARRNGGEPHGYYELGGEGAAVADAHGRRLEGIGLAGQVLGSDAPWHVADGCSGAQSVADPSDRLVQEPGRRPQGRGGAGSAGAEMEHAISTRRQTAGQRRDEHAGCKPEAGGGVGTVGDADFTRLEGRRSLGERGDQLPAWPPGPEDYAGWAAVVAAGRLDLLPASPQSPLRGVVDGVAPRMDRLRLCGNGVVPDTAALAFRTLWNDLMETA